MAFTLYTQSFGTSYANQPVSILETSTKIPATVMASSSGGVINTTGYAVLDGAGALSVYIDTAKTWTVSVLNRGGIGNGVLSQTEVKSVQSIVLGPPNTTAATYDGSNRVTGFTIGSVTFTVTGWGSSNIVFTGSDGSSKTLTLDGSGRFQSTT